MGAGTVKGGAGASGGGGGSAFGNGLFIQGTQDVTLAPGAGETLTIAGVIADQTGSQPGASSQGTGGLNVQGAGVVTLEAVNTFTGATTIGDGGTLALSGTGSVAGSSVTLDAGLFDISGVSGTETVTMLSSDAGGTVALGSNTLIAGGGVFAGTITSTGGAIGVGVGGTLDLLAATLPPHPLFVFAGGGEIDTAATFATIGGFVIHDTLDVRPAGVDLALATASSANGTLTIATTGGGGGATIVAAGALAGSQLLATSDGHGGVDVTTNVWNVSDEAGLNQAIAEFDAFGVPGSYTIALSGDVALTSDLLAFDNTSDASVVIDGGGHTLDGGSRYPRLLRVRGQRGD